MYDMQIMHP